MYSAVQTMSQRPAWSAGISPSKPVLTMFSFRPSLAVTASYDSTSKPIGLVASLGSKNSIGEYSMSTQLDAGPWHPGSPPRRRAHLYHGWFGAQGGVDG